MAFASKLVTYRRWIAPACIVFVVLLLSAQVLHVHPDDGPSSATCLICVSAHTSAPASSAVALVMLIALASIAMVSELSAPSTESVLPLFIRPPPSR